MNWHLFSAFLLITAILVIVPGPIVTLVIATGASRGIRAAMQTVIGTTLGNALLLTCIALGISWILKTSAEVFDYVRLIGAAYLVWLGIQAWRHAGEGGEAAPPGGHVYAWRGFMVALTNPKTIAFFTAFLPQFIDPALPVGRQLWVMCTVSVITRRDARCRLGAGGGLWPRLPDEAAAENLARPYFGAGADRRRHLAVAAAPPGLGFMR